MTFVVADVLFPAFFFPYFAQATYPLAALAALSTECLVFALLNRRSPRVRLFPVVVVANLASSLAGVAIAAFLSDGLRLGLTRSTGPGNGGSWTPLAISAWLVAFAVSIVLEYVAVRAMTRRAPLRRTGLAVVLANVSSYFVLLVAFQASAWWSLQQRSASRTEPRSPTRLAAASLRSPLTPEARLSRVSFLSPWRPR